MYGAASAEAYERSRQADVQSLSAHVAWFHAADLNLSWQRNSSRPPSVEGPELVRLRRQPCQRSPRKQEKLEAVVAKAVDVCPVRTPPARLRHLSGLCLYTPG